MYLRDLYLDECTLITDRQHFLVSTVTTKWRKLTHSEGTKTTLNHICTFVIMQICSPDNLTINRSVTIAFIVLHFIII